MNRRWMILLFSFLTLSLFSREHNPYELSIFGGDPSAIVEGCVSAITGDYFFNQEDLVVKGHEPIVLRTRYFSGKGNRKYGGWNFFASHLIANLSIYKNANIGIYFLEIPEKMGVRLVYKADPVPKKEEMHFQLIGCPGGLTNCSTGEISARLNLRNNRVYRDGKDKKQVIVQGADGSKRCYRMHEPFDDAPNALKIETSSVKLFLTYEVLPNGNKVHYNWDDKNRLIGIKTTNHNDQKVYASVSIYYNKPDKKHLESISIDTSDGRRLYYVIDSHKKQFLLKEVQSPEKPNETFEYWDSKSNGRFISHKKSPEGRYLQLSHYDEKKKVPYTKVKNLHQPAGPNSEGQVTHSFEYNFGEYEKKGGSTEVRDAHGNLRKFHYNEQFLLTSIQNYIGEHTFFSAENIYWWPNNNWLRNKTLVRQDGQPLFSHTYDYDNKGNVIDEQFIGNLTGQAISNPSESYQIRREFYPNTQLHKEHFPNGKTIEYTYVPHTDLIASIIISGEGSQQRSFYFYADTILVIEIHDDGLEKDPKNLNGVTERQIKEITPLTHSAYIGFPELITNSYFDLNTHEKILLNRQRIGYTEQGHIYWIEHYDAQGELRYILRYNYDEKGRLIHKTDPLGRLQLITYDANDNPTSDINPNQDYLTYNHFDLSNRLILTTQDSQGRGVQKVTRGYNALHQKIHEIDTQGNTTYYNNNPFGQPLQITEPLLSTKKGELSTPTTEYTYNALGNPITKKDPEGHLTITRYTARGSPYHIIHPDGSEEYYTYDLTGNLSTHTSPTGVQTKYTHDYLGRMTSKKIYSRNEELLSEERYLYNALHLIEKTDPDGVKTTYSYDGAGRKIKEEVHAEGQTRTTLFAFDSLGRLNKTTKLLDAQAEVLLREYDLLDRIIEEKEEDEKGNLYSITKYSYDDFNNQTALTKEVQVGASVTQFFYDPFKRLIKKIDPLGNETHISYNDVHPTPHGQYVVQKTTTLPKGNQTIETFDAHGNLSTLEKLTPSQQPLLKEECFYNLNNQKTKQTSTLYNPSKIITKAWKYDARGRVIELTEALSEPIEKTTRYTYTPDGLLSTLTKPDRVIITYSYNDLGKVTQLTTSDGSIHYELSYDKLGNIIIAEDLIQQTITKRSYSHFGDLLEETQSNRFTTKRTYDPIGRKTSLTLPDHSQVEYIYDPYHLKEINRNDSSGFSIYQHQYTTYDLSHNLLSESLIKEQGEVRHKVDLLNRTIETISPHSNERITTFNPNGNLLEYYRDEALSEFAYNDLDQLTNETGTFTHSYNYDAHHNRVEKDNSLYDLNTLHQLLQTEQIQFAYDLNGNLILEETSSKKITYEYDGLDRLAAMHMPNEVYRFYYDYWNRLFTQQTLLLQNNKWVIARQEDYLYDELNELGAYPKQLRILGQGHGAEIGAAVAIEVRNQVYIPMHDLFGNVIALLDPNKEQPLETYAYSSFGEEKAKSDTFINPWHYQSKRKIEHLVYFGRRFYHPETGRWITTDPKGYEQGANLYQYLLNNPFGHFDLYGLEVEGSHRGFGNFFSHAYQKTKPVVIDVLQNPRFQGSMQALSGFAEASVGAAMAYTPLAPLGAALLTHGADHFAAGCYAAISGRHRTTGTAQLLQKTGMSSETATRWDNNASFVGTLAGGGLIYKASREAAALAPFNLTKAGRTISNERVLFNFTDTAGRHMNEVERRIPIHILDKVIKSPVTVLKDPQGASKAMMHYSQVWKNGKLYNVEVLYDKTTNTIPHFQYTQKPIGPLTRVSK